MLLLATRAVEKLAERRAYKSNLQQLNKDGNCNILAVAEVEISTITRGQMSCRLSFWKCRQNKKTDANHSNNKRLFVALETSNAEVLYLFLHSKEADESKYDSMLLEGAKIDTKVSADDRGVSVLMASNTVVKNKVTNCNVVLDNVFVFEPHHLHPKQHKVFEVKVIVGQHKNSKFHTAAACAWLNGMAIQARQRGANAWVGTGKFMN